MLADASSAFADSTDSPNLSQHLRRMDQNLCHPVCLVEVYQIDQIY